MKHGGVLNRCELGVPYLGFVVFPNRVRLGRAGRLRLRRRMHDLERAFAHGTIGERELQSRGESLFAHARFADDAAWRRTVTSFSREGEVQGPPSRDPGRLVERHREQVPLRLPQQEEAR